MKKKLSNYYFLLLEYFIWIIIFFVVGFRVINLSFNGFIEEVFYKYYLDVLLLSLVVLFPFLFKLIYSEFPFQYLRSKRNELLEKKSINNTNVYITDFKENSKINIENNNIEIVNSSEIEILKSFMNNSVELSNKIFNRSSAYLLIGCLIAFGGVAFFYFQTLSTYSIYSSKANISYNEIVPLTFNSLPRIFILIFVETIAFFFLKQYKSTMEEFRYYDSLKRQRENQFLIANYEFTYKDKSVEILKNNINFLNLNENPSKLNKEETTQILENQKLSKEESDIISKFIDLLKIVKK